MFKQILSVLFLSLMMNMANANQSEDFYNSLGVSLGLTAPSGMTHEDFIQSLSIDQILEAAIGSGDLTLGQIATALNTAGLDANAATFAMVSAGLDADSVVNAITAANPGTTAETLATTLVEAKINYNLRVGITTTDTTTTTRKSFTKAVTGNSGSPLTTEQFINITSQS